jgi:hypothetical protein
MKLSWKLIIAIILFCIAMGYNQYRRTIVEHFGDWENYIFLLWYIKYLNYFKHKKSYETWVAWLYAFPGTSGEALNDVKQRFFQPDCKFKRNWLTEVPAGKNIPLVIGDRTNVNREYKAYLDSVVEGNDFDYSLKAIEDMRQRFMEPDCNYLNPADKSVYNQNYRDVFR